MAERIRLSSRYAELKCDDYYIYSMSCNIVSISHPPTEIY